MKDYWLAKLISSVGEIDSRKRLQKAIYLLQKAGCPLKCEYILHYYGPYSFELANLIDQLDGANIITEEPERMAVGVIRYKSKITSKGNKVLDFFEEKEEGQEAYSKLKSFISKFENLNKTELWVLELAATIAYYYQGNWKKAQKQTSTFKKVSIGDKRLEEALNLAKGFKKSA